MGKLFKALIVLGLLCSRTMADLSEFRPLQPGLNYYELNATRDGPVGRALNWGGLGGEMPVIINETTFQFFPNTSKYDPADPDWSDGTGDGNRWMEESAFFHKLESLGADETGAFMTINVSAFDLDDRYTLYAYISSGDSFSFMIKEEDEVEINGTGTTTLSIDSLAERDSLVIGFRMEGINANPATDWGSATVTIESVNTVPEPSTIGLLGLSGGALVFFRRRLRREKNDPALPRLRRHHSAGNEPGF